MHGIETFLVALAIMLLAAVGAILVYPHAQDSLGFGMGIFALAGAFMLYREFF